MNDLDRIATALERIAEALDRLTQSEPEPPGGEWSPRVLANAAAIRHYFRAAAPATARQVRNALGWSYERATPAFEAYLAGADTSTSPAPSQS